MLSAAIWLVGIIFAAGVFWKTVKDLKGVSGKVNAAGKQSDRRYLSLCLVIIQFVPEKDRATAAAMLKAGMD